MRIHILTLFPSMFNGPLSESMLKRAQDKGIIEIHLHNIRDYAHDRHGTADDYPYGGSPGMLMKPEPIFEATEAVQELIRRGRGQEAVFSASVILLSPQGRLFSQSLAQDLATRDDIILICGHYEGVDDRVREHLVTDEISIGDYVLTGGELAAMVIVDSVGRLIPGVLGSQESVLDDSIASGLLQYPQYTRPAVYRDWAVPDILLSGNHKEIAQWRIQQSLMKTLKHRPDLLPRATLTEEAQRLLEAIRADSET
ncbi:MAG: tRNA (guanosine(37)-N1)-methyltransferase TrmD [Chloroflexi bacterium]|nr:tRNA (guanosine(37)-N1)-methyltransferase TrmD [Chloroflexota bacterium]